MYKYPWALPSDEINQDRQSTDLSAKFILDIIFLISINREKYVRVMEVVQLFVTLKK